MKIEKFEDLKCWQLGRELCKIVYDYTRKEQFSKDYKIRDQIRASSGSVMDNIAEGFERGGNKEFIQFLFISRASNAEVRSQLYRAFDYNYITEKEFKSCYSKCIDIKISLTALIKSLKLKTDGLKSR